MVPEMIVDAAYIATPEAHSTAVATRERLGEPACAEFLEPHRAPRASSPRSASFRTRRGTASVSRETRTMASSKTRRSPRPRPALCASRRATPAAQHLRPRGCRFPGQIYWRGASSVENFCNHTKSHIFVLWELNRSNLSECECCVNLPDASEFFTQGRHSGAASRYRISYCV